MSSRRTGRPSTGPIAWKVGRLCRPETATFQLLGVEANYANGRTRLYVLDIGIGHFAAFIFHSMIDTQRDVRALAGDG